MFISDRGWGLLDKGGNAGGQKNLATVGGTWPFEATFGFFSAGFGRFGSFLAVFDYIRPAFSKSQASCTITSILSHFG